MDNPYSQEVIELNVGGLTEGFKTSRDMLCKDPNSYLAELFSGKQSLRKIDGKVFIDRNPQIFTYVLDYLRNDQTPLNFQDPTMKELFDLELKHWKLMNPAEQKKYKAKLQEIFSTQPQTYLATNVEKWKELGPLNLELIV